MNHLVELADGRTLAALGQGTWFLGENSRSRQTEIEALRTGFAEGMTLIDTAEMYGSGKSEDMVGEAISTLPRDQLYLVSKVLPQNANSRNMQQSCEASLRRLGTDYLDLYLYHWRGATPLEETVDCLERLVAAGKIRAWGVSNFDIDDMEELFQIPGGDHCVVNQVLYHLGSRGIEYSLKPWLKKHQVALMAYCPLAQAGSLRDGLFEDGTVQQVAEKHGATVSQLLLAWAIRDGNTIAIPRTGQAAHTRQNAAADSLQLDSEDLAALDAAFPPPRHKEYLDIQ